jgi:hypothetical protein
MMLNRLFLTSCLGLCALAGTARADRFHLTPPDRAGKMTEGEADVVRGVLVGEEDGLLVIRVEGGVMRLPKGSVHRIEKDDLTTEAIEQAEAARAEELAAANRARRVLVASEREQRARLRANQAALREATARREVEVVEAVEAPAPVYDPVLHVVVPARADAGAIRKELGGLIRRDLQKNARRQLERR